MYLALGINIFAFSECKLTTKKLSTYYVKRELLWKIPHLITSLASHPFNLWVNYLPTAMTFALLAIAVVAFPLRDQAKQKNEKFALNLTLKRRVE